MAISAISWVQWVVVLFAVLLRLVAVGWVFVMFALFTFGVLPVLVFSPLILAGYGASDRGHPALWAADVFLLLAALTFPDSTDVDDEVLVPLLAIVRLDPSLKDENRWTNALFIIGYTAFAGYVLAVILAWVW